MAEEEEKEVPKESPKQEPVEVVETKPTATESRVMKESDYSRAGESLGDYAARQEAISRVTPEPGRQPSGYDQTVWEMARASKERSMEVEGTGGREQWFEKEGFASEGAERHAREKDVTREEVLENVDQPPGYRITSHDVDRAAAAKERREKEPSKAAAAVSSAGKALLAGLAAGLQGRKRIGARAAPAPTTEETIGRQGRIGMALINPNLNENEKMRAALPGPRLQKINFSPKYNPFAHPPRALVQGQVAVWGKRAWLPSMYQIFKGKRVLGEMDDWLTPNPKLTVKSPFGQMGFDRAGAARSRNPGRKFAFGRPVSNSLASGVLGAVRVLQRKKRGR